MVWLVSLWSDSNSVGHILLVYAIVITVGLLLGRIKIFGISLGVTFVLFAGLAAGYFGFTVNTTVMHFLRDFGLILFVFFIGLQVGPSFFSSFRNFSVLNISVSMDCTDISFVGVCFCPKYSIRYMICANSRIPLRFFVPFCRSFNHKKKRITSSL